MAASHRNCASQNTCLWLTNSDRSSPRTTTAATSKFSVLPQPDTAVLLQYNSKKAYTATVLYCSQSEPCTYWPYCSTYVQYTAVLLTVGRAAPQTQAWRTTAEIARAHGPDGTSWHTRSC